MPDKTAVINGAIAARMACTGESRRLATESIRTLNGSAGTNGSRPVPDAHTPEQLDLEARLLLALTRICYQQFSRVSDPYPLECLSPQLDGLDLYVRPAALPRFVVSVVPRWREDGVEGVPGLRARLGSRSVTLTTLTTAGQSTTARLRLVGVTPKLWAAALAAADDLQLDSRARGSYVHDAHLRGRERRALRDFGSFYGAHLASLLLRRFHLLSTACWVDGWADLEVKVEWCHGPRLREVVDALFHPRFGVGTRITLKNPELLGDVTPFSVTLQGPPPPHSQERRMDRRDQYLETRSGLQLRRQELCRRTVSISSDRK